MVVIKQKREFILICFLLVAVSLNAQKIDFSASVDRNVVPPGSAVTLTVTVSGDIARVPKPELPELDNFDILSQGSSRNISFVNGKLFSSISYSYSLVPRKVGKFTIGPCKIKVKNRVFKTEPIEIEVSKEAKDTGTTKKQQPGQHLIPPQEESVEKGEGEDIFIRTSVNKKDVYKGEQIIMTFKLYSSTSFLSQPLYIPPESKGFWKEDMGKEKQSQQIIKGRRYEVVELRYALYPITVGNLTIGEAKLNCFVSKPVHDIFSFGFSRGVKKELKTKPISIKVRSLPPQPEKFSGAVGSFSISAELDRDTVKQNEPLTLITTVVGDGNVRNIDIPKVRIPGFKIYESGADVRVYESGGRMKGKKTFKTLVVPNRAGDFKVPETSFNYFEPDRKKYVTLTTKSLPFTVIPGEGGLDASTFYKSGDVEVMGRDINFIKRDVKLKDQGSLLGSVKYFLMVNLILLCVFLWITISLNVKEKAKSKEHILRRRGAFRNALKLIAKSEKENRVGNTKEAYELLHRAIVKFFADKCNLSVWGTTEEGIASYLRQKGVGKETENQITKLLHICNQARYSKQVPDGEQLTKSIQLTKTILKQLHSL
jgi:hypothetical protein